MGFLPLALLLALAAPPRAGAEYRAYKLAILDDATKHERVVVGTLDPLQYSGYFQVKKTESVRLTATWMCRARSDGFAPICPPPPTKGQPAPPGTKSK